ncbi:MAG: glycosyl transferase-like protein, partial [Phenylobacterium zucineum]
MIRAEPDGYDMGKRGLMGRQAAGNGFLRAAVKARGDQTIYGYTPNRPSAVGFQAIVKGIDPAARFEWISDNALDSIPKVGALYLADLTVSNHARLRQRTGVASYSLCGVTHTTASHGAMDQIAALLREPVMPWDALVCTSSAVVGTVNRILEAERELFQWQHGAPCRKAPPQLPVIPLGAHWQDYDFDAEAKARARQALGLADDEVVGLFVGRLAFHAKAHPYPMFRGLQLAAERTGRRMVLILCGWFANPNIEKAFMDGAREFAPDVRTIFVDGRETEPRTNAWAGSDIFISLSDNIQETFGLTPIEAMAAGLPVVVSDYDGYRDTVRHEIDGFRVRTYAPGDGMGAALARSHEALAMSYDQYCWGAAATTAVDIPETADAIVRLVENPDLRRRMGDAGRERARTVYDWDAIFRQYQDLWAELAAR